MLRNLLAPTDFSRASRHAVDYAAKLAEHFGATLWLVHVSAAPVTEHEHEHEHSSAASIYHRAREEQSRRVHQQMAELVDALAAAYPGLKVETEFRIGVPYGAIIDAATDLGSDMIVMGTAGLTGFSHFLIGSTAERVVRLSKIPVLTVRAER